MGPRPMLGLTRRTYPMQCSHRPHAARLALPAALEGTMLHRCRRPRTGHPREAQSPTKQGLPSCLINRYPFGHQTITTGTFVTLTRHGARGVSGSWPHKQGKALAHARPLLLL